MKWAYAIGQKMKAALLLAAVFIMILGKNLSEKHHLSELGTSFSSVFEDRLVVEGYIYSLSDHLYQKRLLLDGLAGSPEEHRQAVSAALQDHNRAIFKLVSDYGRTRLTPAESASFDRFRAQLETIDALEATALRQPAGGPERGQLQAQITGQFTQAAATLHRLSGIQIAEGRQLQEQSRRRIAGASLLTELELAALIGLGLMVQGIVWASRTLRPKHQPPHPGMN